MENKNIASKNKTSFLKKNMDDFNEINMEDQQRADLITDQKIIEFYQSINKNSAWIKINKTISPKAELFPRRAILHWRAIAAVLIPLVAAGVIFMKIQNQKNLYAYKDVKPGSSKAVLQIGDGEKIQLQEFSEKQIFNSRGLALGKNTNNTFICEKIVDEENNATNLMYVPSGGEYKLVLCDGTKISVNSDSKIQFPNAFDKDKRQVSLSGEAYFEVARNENQPFEVHTKNAVITVLGTKFNVSSYSKERFEQITLEEGHVSVRYKDQTFDLLPGMQLYIDTQSNTAKVNDVEANLYSSWKEGLFRFQDMKLDELTQKIERWYNVKFVFENENCKSLRFTGAYARNANFNDFINLIESTTGVIFTRKNDEIMISKK